MEMNTQRYALKAFLGLLAGSFLGVDATIYTVTNTLDSGAGSFRQAILDNNGNAGPNDIHFNIPGTGPFRIQPLSELPPITTPVTIDGYTQPGSSVNTATDGTTNAVLQIELNGSNYTVGDGQTTGYGLQLLAGSGGSTVRGLVINEWFLTGIFISESINTKVFGNFIGTNVAGTAQLANQSGVYTESDNTQVGSGNVADRNLLAGSFMTYINGYTVFSTANSGFSFKGNLVGVDRTGSYELGNGLNGVRLATVDNAQVGGSLQNERNVICGYTALALRLSGTTNSAVVNNYIGVDVTGSNAIGNHNMGLMLDPRTTSTTNNVIEANVISANEYGIILGSLEYASPGDETFGNRIVANLIGTDATGTIPLGNRRHGIWVMEGNNTIGGGNVISANGQNGILITSGSQETVVQGNFIGTNASGTAPLGNGWNGIQLGTQGGVNYTSNNLIGGGLSGLGNVISGNERSGILITSYSYDNQIQGNFIGTDYAGLQPIPNGRDGVKIVCSFGNEIGGLFVSDGNVIAYNGHGVNVGYGHDDTASVGNSVLNNSIFLNEISGITLHKHKPPYEPENPKGPNHFQTSPFLTKALTNGSATQIKGNLESVRNTSFRIQFFSNGSSSKDQGKYLLGETEVTTNGEGRAWFNVSVDPTSTSSFVTATATRIDSTATPTDTSEFSLAKRVEGN